MAKIVTITNGSGQEELINGSYSVTAEVGGYDNSSINPSTLNVVAGTDAYQFTISANGILTLHVTEEGTAAGTAVVGAKFARTDSAGTVYGDEIVSDDSGNAVFNNVPYGENAQVVYYKQTASDGEHESDNTVKSITLANETETVEVQNPTGAVRTISLTDANYANLPIENGTITLTNE